MERRTYTRREVVKGGAAALLGASLALPLASRRAGALTRGVSVGIYPSGNGPLYGDFAELDAYINLAGGVVPKLVSVFSAWIPEGWTTYLYPNTDDLSLFYNLYPGSVLVWTWEPRYGVTLQQIKSGAHDAYIDEVARRIGAVGQRVLIRFAHEMNGRWTSWPWLNQPPADYIAAWKRIVSRFRSLGATNAEWVWAPNVIADSTNDFSPWYPGDEYVDWTGLDGYNWGTVHNAWYTFRERCQYSIGVITALSPRGIIITETGCHSRGPNNESKGYWYSQMAAELKQNYPQLQGLINSHMIDQRNSGEDAEWRVDMPITALDDWQNLVADPQFQVPLGAVRTASAGNAAPKVTAVAPQNGATGVKRNTNLTATFSEKMDPTTLTNSNFKLFKVTSSGTTQITNVSVSLSPDGLKATLNPFGTTTTLLAKSTKYKAVVTTGAKDVAGNSLDQNSTTSGNQQMAWSFKTGLQ
jgi:hypothetical protein